MDNEKVKADAKTLLEKLPRQRILAIAGSLHAIAKAQVAAGQNLTAEDAEIMERATRLLPKIEP